MGMNKESILRMARGSIEERVDREVGAVVENILDVNTKPDAKRKITLTLEFLPDADRDNIRVTATTKTTLVPANAVQTSMYITADGKGELVIAEATPQIPGQLDMAGKEQTGQKLLKFAAVK